MACTVRQLEAYARWRAKPGSAAIQRANYDRYCGTLEGRQARLESQRRAARKRRQARKTSLPDRLMKNIRSGLHKCLSGTYKQSRTIEYVGCSLVELMIYLENQFSPSMSWENYGEWQVDHRRPVASFDFKGDNLEAALRVCWHYTNLQPLWALDNARKNAKWDGEI